MEGKQLFLKPNEAKFIALSVVSLLDQLKESARNPEIPFNPEARKDLKQMIEAGTSLQIKLKKLGFNVDDLPPYMDGDETEFLTKES